MNRVGRVPCFPGGDPRTPGRAGADPVLGPRREQRDRKETNR